MASIQEFIIQMYFGQLYSGLGRKMYSKSLSLALTLAEISGDNVSKAELEYIYNNTTKNMGISLPILEHIIDKQYLNIRHKNVPKMKRERINGKLIPNHKIMKALSDAYVKITSVVTRIAKELDVDIEFDASKYPIPDQ